MPLIDNIGDVAFSSRYPIDKILEESPSLEVTGIPAAEDSSTPGLATETWPHSSGANTVVNGRYSMDGTNYYPFGAYITGPFVGDSGYNEYLYAVAYNDEDTVYIEFRNGYITDQSVYLDFVMESLA